MLLYAGEVYELLSPTREPKDAGIVMPPLTVGTPPPADIPPNKPPLCELTVSNVCITNNASQRVRTLTFLGNVTNVPTKQRCAERWSTCQLLLNAVGMATSPAVGAVRIIRLRRATEKTALAAVPLAIRNEYVRRTERTRAAAEIDT